MQVVVSALVESLRAKLALDAHHIHGLVVRRGFAALAMNDVPALGGDVYLAVVAAHPAGSLDLGRMGAIGVFVVKFGTAE